MIISQYFRKVIPVGLWLAFSLGVAPGAPSGESQAFVQGNTAFALDLYSHLKSGSQNVFFSPYSISTCLAITYAGARGATAKQMATALHFSKDESQVSSSFAELQRQLKESAERRGFQLNLANALWAQEGHAFLPAFLNLARGQYQANLNQADFKTDAESARAAINRWVEQMTRNRINDILPPGTVGPTTRLVLANAIYFKGAWESQFRARETRPMPFHVSASNRVQAPLMHKTYEVRYLEDKDMQAVELPYVGNGLSMVVLLPRRIDGCSDLESRLTPALLSSSLAQMQQQRVEVLLPKFRLESGYDLVRPLTEMGMPDAFGSKADFSGMDGTKLLYLSGVFHKAWVEVNEEGTEAAAATAAVAVPSAMVRPAAPPPIFRADHPFIFLIRDTHSGSILFLGRLAQPSA